MKKFALLTIGYEKPTEEIMTAWKTWFASIQDHIIDQFHLADGIEFSHQGRKELPRGLDAITGMMIVKAENKEQAEKIASSNPFVTSIQIYEVR